MTVTTSSYTTNSLRINVSNETTSSNIIVAINQGMVKGGWTLYDSTIAGSAGYTFTPISTYVYRVLNADAVTYKYIILRINAMTLTINTSSCESWDNSAHLPTNETWHGAGAFTQNYDLKDSIILVSATARHCIIWTFIRSEPGMWTGVFEFERVAGEDVTTGSPVPCWAWTNSLMLGSPYGQFNETVYSQIMMAFPRAPDGSVGAAAARIYAPTTNRGMFPPIYTQGITQPTSLDPNKLHLGSYYGSGYFSTSSLAYGWDTLKTIVSPIAADAMLKVMPVGRAYNVGITKPLGGALDTTFVNLDGTGGWPSASGASTECLLLPLNGGSEQSWNNASYTNFSTGTTAVYGQAGSVIVGKVIAIGSTVWMATNQGVYTWDASQGQNSGITQRYTNLATDRSVWDIVHDGQRTIYASTTTGVVAIDTETFAPTFSASAAITTGTAFLAIDQKYIYATHRTSSTNLMQVYSFARSNFLQSSTYTLSSATAVASGLGTPVPDYLGNVYIASQGGVISATANHMYISKYFADTGNELIRTYNPKFPLGSTAAASDAPTSFYVDNAANRVYLAVGGSSTVPGFIYEVSTTTLSTVTTSITPFLPGAAAGLPVASAAMGSTGVIYDYRGDLNIVPVRGQFWISPKKTGISALAANGYVVRAQFNYPHPIYATGPGPIAAGLPIVMNSGTNQIANSPMGYGTSMYSNGARLYTAFCNVVASDNRIYYVGGLHNVAYTAQGFSNGRLVIKG